MIMSSYVTKFLNGDGNDLDVFKGREVQLALCKLGTNFFRLFETQHF